MSIRKYIDRVKEGENLRPEEIEEVMQLIMAGEVANEDLKDFLMVLREKGPNVDEITGAARIMRRFVVEITTQHPVVLDTCGTGGDKKDTFNISTLAALVVAGAGVVVAKHGNRSVSSKCGSADILEALGVNLNMEQQHLNRCLDEVGVAFLFAQRLHPAMKNVAPVRKELGVETIFNILGPLTNPAQATHQMMGVYNRDLTEPMVHVLKNLGLRRAMVVHGSDGMDEVTTTGVSFISEFNGKDILSYEVNPREFGVAIADPDALQGGDLKKNLAIANAVLDGQQGPHRDIVVLNAGCALYIAEKIKSISEGIVMAAAAIDSGAARAKLKALKEFTCHGV